MTETSGYSIVRLLFLGLVFHLVYIGTVFDCYFTSPVVHGMHPYKVPHAPAKRLVLIVGDGLRADFVFSANATAIVPQAPERVAPYLREVVESRGAYGVSHTRVPTESRPGHVAIIAGMYEDVSAVTKGWKTNPVEFDSVFNQSSHTFSFGSPDILPMFARGATPGKVKTWCYEEEDEDFTKDATALDTWVLDHLQVLLKNATADDTLKSQLREDGVIFFLHLLGLDTTGHSYRPHSKEYMRNIQVVDNIVRDTEKLLSDFYGDAETSYIFTADHGMSKIGNHGDGDPDSTRTPLIAWGAGIRGPQTASSPDIDEYSAPWELSHLVRRDVEQADIAALMSTLLGTPWPVNSVGVLPDIDLNQHGYLETSKGEEGIARAGLTNAQVLLEHYRVKHELKQQHALRYKPFKGLDHSSAISGWSEVSRIERLVQDGHHREARATTYELVQMTLQGLRYLETYDRTLIRMIVSVAYTGWIAYSTAFILAPAASLPRISGLSIVSVTTVIVFWSLFAIQKAPWTFYVYIVFPVYFWRGAVSRIWDPLVTLAGAGRSSYVGRKGTFALVGGAALTVAALQCMVLGYTHRTLWGVGFGIIGILWPLTSWPSTLLHQRPGLLIAWATSCLASAIFPLLRVDPDESLETILAGGSCMLVAGAFGIYAFVREKDKSNEAVMRMFGMQFMFIGTSMAITAGSITSLQAKQGLPIFNQLAGWIILVAASIYPFLQPVAHPTPETKLLTYFLTFCPCFVILSIRAEGLFYLSYCTTLYLWIRVEEAVRSDHVQANGGEKQVNGNAKKAGKAGAVRGWNRFGLRVDDVRVALFFLFFVQVGFFGTGNVASISSFYLEPVYRLVPIFNPFLMASLLIFKILAPYVQLSACFALLNKRLGMPPFALFLVALALTDGMTMTFFFNVTDTGSWLQIGQSISHFCITSLLLVFSAGISAAGEHLMRDQRAGAGKEVD